MLVYLHIGWHVDSILDGEGLCPQCLSWCGGRHPGHTFCKHLPSGVLHMRSSWSASGGRCSHPEMLVGGWTQSAAAHSWCGNCTEISALAAWQGVSVFSMRHSRSSAMCAAKPGTCMPTFCLCAAGVQRNPGITFGSPGSKHCAGHLEQSTQVLPRTNHACLWALSTHSHPPAPPPPTPQATKDKTGQTWDDAKKRAYDQVRLYQCLCLCLYLYYSL